MFFLLPGLFTDSKISFSNAVVRADQHDLDFWLSKENMEKAPANMKGFFEGPMATHQGTQSMKYKAKVRN